MEKSIGYWIEKLIGPLVGLIATLICYLYWSKGGSFISNDNFFDKIISISSTLFGFLLAVLTLIIQSDSTTVQTMKTHGSFNRLITFNKSIVFLFATNCLTSLFLYFLNEVICNKSGKLLMVLSSGNFFIFIWAFINTLIFVLLFYRLLIVKSI